MNQYFENNKNIISNVSMHNVSVKDTSFSIFTDNGVFNKKGLDYGTRVLLENIDLGNKKTFLDVGCGCGPIGIFISLQSNDYIVDMIDVNERAIKLTNMAISYNKLTNTKAYISDVYNNVKNKYDMIITNPPIHAGKDVVYNIIENAVDYLNENGEIWIVIRKDQGCKSLIKNMSNIYDFEIIKRDNGFYVLKAKGK